jgi:hypothetical protein
MKTYYATQDIEDMAARGISELILDDDTVLTDLATDAARRAGIALVQRGRAVQVAAAVPAPRPAAAAAPVARTAAKPSGCQHGPLGSAASQSPIEPKVVVSGTTNTVVDQMVGLVRQLAGKQ